MKEGIGSVHQRTGEILAYLYNWSSTFLVKPSSTAILALTFAQYFVSGIMDGNEFCDGTIIHLSCLDCGPPDELVKLVAIFSISRLTFLLYKHLHFFFKSC